MKRMATNAAMRAHAAALCAQNPLSVLRSVACYSGVVRGGEPVRIAVCRSGILPRLDADGLQVALLPSVTTELRVDVGAAVPALVADVSEPQALDLGGDDRATDVIGGFHAWAAAGLPTTPGLQVREPLMEAGE